MSKSLLVQIIQSVGRQSGKTFTNNHWHIHREVDQDFGHYGSRAWSVGIDWRGGNLPYKATQELRASPNIQQHQTDVAGVDIGVAIKIGHAAWAKTKVKQRQTDITAINNSVAT